MNEQPQPPTITMKLDFPSGQTAVYAAGRWLSDDETMLSVCRIATRQLGKYFDVRTFLRKAFLVASRYGASVTIKIAPSEPTTGAPSPAQAPAHVHN